MNETKMSIYMVATIVVAILIGLIEGSVIIGLITWVLFSITLSLQINVDRTLSLEKEIKNLVNEVKQLKRLKK